MLHSRLGYALAAGPARSARAVVARRRAEPIRRSSRSAASRSTPPPRTRSRRARQALQQGQREGLERLLRRLVPAERARLAAGGRRPRRRTLRAELRDRRRGAVEHPLPRPADRALRAGCGARAAAEQRRELRPDAARRRSSCCRSTQGPEGARLWPEDNPWWQAWADNLDPERLLRLVLPLGDLEDMVALSVEQVQARDRAALAALAAALRQRGRARGDRDAARRRRGRRARRPCS